ncbi:hypothetical protein D9M71_329210 [compost metagenome]
MNQAVGVQVQTGAASAFVRQRALIELSEVTAAGHALVTGGDGVATQSVNQRSAPGLIVDLAIIVLGVAADPVPRRAVAVFT